MHAYFCVITRNAPISPACNIIGLACFPAFDKIGSVRLPAPWTVSIVGQDPRCRVAARDGYARNRPIVSACGQNRTTSAAHPSRFNDERRAKSSRAESPVSVARGTAGRN